VLSGYEDGVKKVRSNPTSLHPRRRHVISPVHLGRRLGDTALTRSTTNSSTSWRTRSTRSSRNCCTRDPRSPSPSAYAVCSSSSFGHFQSSCRCRWRGTLRR
jgi:hypothetical protein